MIGENLKLLRKRKGISQEEIATDLGLTRSSYSGYENAVMKNLKQRIDSLDVTDKIFDVVVPIEKKIKVKNGKRVEVEEKVYPGILPVFVGKADWANGSKHRQQYRSCRRNAHGTNATEMLNQWNHWLS